MLAEGGTHSTMISDGLTFPFAHVSVSPIPVGETMLPFASRITTRKSKLLTLKLVLESAVNNVEVVALDAWILNDHAQSSTGSYVLVSSA